MQLATQPSENFGSLHFLFTLKLTLKTHNHNHTRTHNHTHMLQWLIP